MNVLQIRRSSTAIESLPFLPRDPKVAETVVSMLLDQSRQNGRDIQNMLQHGATTAARLDAQDVMLRQILAQQREDAPVIRTARLWQRALTYLAGTTLVAALGGLAAWAAGWLGRQG